MLLKEGVCEIVVRIVKIASCHFISLIILCKHKPQLRIVYHNIAHLNEETVTYIPQI